MKETSQKVVPNTRLRDYRHQQQWTQALVAEALGVTELTVRRWEKGQTRPSPYYEKKLCDLFKKTPEELGLTDVSACVAGAALDHEASESLPPIAAQAQETPSSFEDQILDTSLLIAHDERAMQPDRSPLREGQSRLVWSITSVACLALVISGSLFWVWWSASSRSTGQKVHTSRLSYYVCGDQAILTDIKNWTTVPAGSLIHTPDYSGPANGYTGPGGNPARSPRNCSGRYQWAWNQSPVQAMWIWSNAYLPNGKCSVDVHIPSWYAGAPDALYTLTIRSSTSSASYTFDPQDQNQPATTWITLHIQNQVRSIPMPNSPNNIYTLTFVLTNGETRNWYLGAEAIRFDCSANL
jgi:transcriptional regulator with XRE-family HTH domain